MVNKNQAVLLIFSFNKMASESLLLSWQEYEQQAPNLFRGLWKDQYFADVTLSTKGNKLIRAHKVILSSVSSFFKNIFQNNQSNNIFIYLKDISHRVLERVVEFIYMGRCEIDQTDLSDFLTIGKSLEVIGLLDKLSIGATSCHKTDEKNYNCEENSATIKFNENIFEKASVKFKEVDCIQRVDTIDQQLKETMQETENFETWTKETDEQNTQNKLIVQQNEDVVCTQCGIYSCNTCESNSSVISLRKPLKSIVNEGMKHQCPECHLKYVNKKDMIKHKKFVHDGIHTTYYCNFCEFQCLRKHLLVKHKEVIHEGLRHACIHCDYKATSKYTLDVHKRSIHEGEKYTCSVCEFTSSYKKSVRKHYERIHKGAMVESIRGKGYDCEVCGFSATGQDKLSQHKRFNHE